MKNASVFKPKPTNNQRIFMDGLNFSARFLPSKGRSFALKNFTSRVQTAVSAFRNSGYELVVFIDANRISREANHKYCSRHEQNIRSGKMNFIPFGELMLGGLFEKFGVPVLYSFDHDNDDTLAVYAQHFNALVLSGDQDFFRYQGSSFRICKDFTIKSNKITLIDSSLNPKKCIKARDLLPELPKVIFHNPCISSLEAGMFRKGIVTPLIKEIGNPVIGAKPLRAAMYARLGYKKIKEVLPFWNGTDVEWTNDDVYGDPAFDYYLTHPIEARDSFLSQYLKRPEGIEDKLWEKHVFGVNGTVAEICCVFKGTFNAIMVLLTFGNFQD